MHAEIIWDRQKNRLHKSKSLKPLGKNCSLLGLKSKSRKQKEEKKVKKVKD